MPSYHILNPATYTHLHVLGNNLKTSKWTWTTIQQFPEACVLQGCVERKEGQ